MNGLNWVLLALPIVGAAGIFLALKSHDRKMPLKRRQDQEDPSNLARFAELAEQQQAKMAEMMAAAVEKVVAVVPANASPDRPASTKMPAKAAAAKALAKTWKSPRPATKPSAKRTAVKKVG
ncbi:hypothetical protein [Mesorhizobium sp. KR9-304]|uniref:hypothetical protein n=1 Tax=Mesorhizobium sp. KR9-304 TaxID=3156614 RepID=UPI0032B57723